jgi:hypothetical protein
MKYIAGLFALRHFFLFAAIKSKQTACPMPHNGIVAGAADCNPEGHISCQPGYRSKWPLIRQHSRIAQNTSRSGDHPGVVRLR